MDDNERSYWILRYHLTQGIIAALYEDPKLTEYAIPQAVADAYQDAKEQWMYQQEIER
jgi:hypothetical protein